jgi:hypothetical protein
MPAQPENPFISAPINHSIEQAIYLSLDLSESLAAQVNRSDEQPFT